MKLTVFFKAFIVAMSLLLYSSCGSDKEEIFPEPEPTYSVVDVKYTLEEGDSVTIKAHNFAPVILHNATQDSSLMTWTEGPKDYVMTSCFLFSPSLPEYLDMDSVAVSTPEWVFGESIATVNRGWTLAEGEHTKPYWSSAMISATRTLSYKLPPYKKIVIKQISKEEILQATVELIVENDRTGEHTSFKGTWTGTLRIPEHAIVVSEGD